MAATIQPPVFKPEDLQSLMINVAAKKLLNYDLSKYNTYFCSDWEGQIPILGIDSDIPFATSGTSVDISQLKDESAFVFLGDALDNGPNEIQIMETFIKLKNNNNDRVVLLAGNRDINKIRLVDEMRIIDNNGEDVVYELVKDFNILELARKISSNWKTTYKFKYGDEELNLIKTVNATSNPGSPIPSLSGWSKFNFDSYTDNRNIYHDTTTLVRVDRIYADTFGAPMSINHRITEFTKYGVITDKHRTILNNNNEIKWAFIAIMNMWMSRIWNVSGIQSGSIWDRLNGLYIKYLKVCHLFASIQVPTGDGTTTLKYAFVSHGGMPVDAILSYPFGYKKPAETTFEADVNTYLTKVINKEDSKFKELLNKFTSDTKEILRRNSSVRKMIAASAELGEITYENKTHVSTSSPIVARSLNIKQLGGNYNKWIKEDIMDNLLDLEPFTSIREYPFYIPLLGYFTYNIMGHVPQGIFPVINSLENNKYNVCTDVSKALGVNPGYAPDSTYGFFVIKNNGAHYVTGQIKFDSSLNRYNTNSVILDGVIPEEGIYYTSGTVTRPSNDMNTWLLTTSNFTVTFTALPGFKQGITVTGITTGGKLKLKKTEEKQTIEGRSRVIYRGPKGAKYVKLNKEYVRLSDIKNKPQSKSKSRPSSSSKCSCTCHPKKKTCDKCKC